MRGNSAVFCFHISGFIWVPHFSTRIVPIRAIEHAWVRPLLQSEISLRLVVGFIRTVLRGSEAVDNSIYLTCSCCACQWRLQICNIRLSGKGSLCMSSCCLYYCYANVVLVIFTLILGRLRGLKELLYILLRWSSYCKCY